MGAISCGFRRERVGWIVRPISTTFRDGGANMALNKKQQEDYLEALADCGLVHASCEKADVLYEDLRVSRLHDKVFAAAFDVARRHHGEQWESATRARGIDGWEEPQFHDGKVCGHKRRYSDRCLEMGLKRFCPEYREKMQVDATISGGVLVVGSKMSEDEWREKHEGKGDAD